MILAILLRITAAHCRIANSELAKGGTGAGGSSADPLFVIPKKNEFMPSDYYDMEQGTDQSAEMENSPEKEDQEENKDSSALLPKSIFGGKDPQVGDEITLCVDAVHEDEVSVYRRGKVKSKGAEKPESTDQEQAPPSEDQMAMRGGGGMYE